MEKLILYGSCYGTAQRYAVKLAEMAGVEAVPYRGFRGISGSCHIFYVGSLYAGRVTGLSKTIRKLSGKQDCKLTILTVGLADPHLEKTAVHIAKAVQKQVPSGLFQKTELFHLRGGLDYPRLHWRHKAMMRMMYWQLDRIPPEERDQETEDMRKTRYETVDFTDFTSLERIAQRIR
jgi:hypothetical protein